MPASAQPRHPSLHLLEDHLDAALAMGEDLLTEKVALADATQHLTMPRLVRQNRELAEFLGTVRTLELSLIARLLQARKRAEEMKRRESRLKPLIALFVAGTAPLVDAAAELGDTSTRDFDTGDTATAFLRSRGLIARDAAGLERLTQLAVGEDYLVAGRIRPGHVARSRRHLPRHPRPAVRPARGAGSGPSAGTLQAEAKDAAPPRQVGDAECHPADDPGSRASCALVAGDPATA